MELQNVQNYRKQQKPYLAGMELNEILQIWLNQQACSSQRPRAIAAVCVCLTP